MKGVIHLPYKPIEDPCAMWQPQQILILSDDTLWVYVKIDSLSKSFSQVVAITNWTVSTNYSYSRVQRPSYCDYEGDQYDSW